MGPPQAEDGFLSRCATPGRSGQQQRPAMSFDVPTGELAPSRGSVPQGLAGQAHSRDTKPQNGTAEGPKKPIVMHWLKMKENLQIYIISPHALFMASLAHTMRAGQPSTERGEEGPKRPSQTCVRSPAGAGNFQICGIHNVGKDLIRSRATVTARLMVSFMEHLLSGAPHRARPIFTSCQPARRAAGHLPTEGKLRRSEGGVTRRLLRYRNGTSATSDPDPPSPSTHPPHSFPGCTPPTPSLFLWGFIPRLSLHLRFVTNMLSETPVCQGKKKGGKKSLFFLLFKSLTTSQKTVFFSVLQDSKGNLYTSVWAAAAS